MKIVFLNVWGDEMTDALVEYLDEQAHDTDIFCFQEVTEEMKRRCASTLSRYVEISDTKFISDKDNFYQATFIRKGIDILSSGTLMAEGMDCGLAIYTEIRGASGSMYICNVHGKAWPSEKLDNPGRILQSRELIDFFKDKSTQVIIGGDFNLLPTTESIKMFQLHGYRDLIDEFHIDTTRNRLAWDRYSVKMYFSDYLFVNSQVQVIGFDVPKNEVSDHLPLLLEVGI